MKFTTAMKSVFGAVILYLFSVTALADIKTHQTFGDYTVHYTVFDSTFLKPETAQAAGIVRAKNQKLVNVSVVRGKDLHGSPALIKGEAKDLMAVTKKLKFKEIREGEAVYYIAPVRSDSEEVMHFHLQVRTDPNGEFHKINFTRKLYKER
ncbi:MAG: DUF4426 domain-containing protein [Cellvibrionaceae bacterium]